MNTSILSLIKMLLGGNNISCQEQKQSALSSDYPNVIFTKTQSSQEIKDSQPNITQNALLKNIMDILPLISGKNKTNKTDAKSILNSIMPNASPELVAAISALSSGKKNAKSSSPNEISPAPDIIDISNFTEIK